MLKMLGMIAGWLISLPCLALAIYVVVSLAMQPAAERNLAGLGYAVAAIVVPFYGAAGVVFNPLVFPRLARPVWLRVAIAVAVVIAATTVGWLVVKFVLPGG